MNTTTPALAATLHGSQHAAAPPGPPAFRNLHVTLSRGEFGLVNWCQRVTGSRGMGHFMYRALFEAVKITIAEHVRKGGHIPPGIAKDFDEWRNEI